MPGTLTSARGSTAVPWLLFLASLGLLLWLWLDGTSAPNPEPIDPSGPPATPAEMDYAHRPAPAADIPTPTPEPTSPADATLSEEPGSTLLGRMRAEPKRYRALVEGARDYFDLDEEQWKGRNAFVRELERHAKEGERILATMDALRWTVAQGRSFYPPLTDRKWQRTNGITNAGPLGGTRYGMRADGLDVTFSVPRAYPKARALATDYPRVDPYPLLIALHDAEDAEAEHPGAALMKRRYGDAKVWGALAKDWCVLLPHARGGTFISNEGQPRAPVFQQPLAVFWKHYHVDFDRFVLDGGRDAFTIANSMPIFFAGVVFRGRWRLDDAMRRQVANFAPIPVYVVGNPKLANDLKAAGHPCVHEGPADARLLRWMQDRRRVAPTTFHWRADRTDQVLPYWVNLDSPNWNAAERCVHVHVERPSTEVPVDPDTGAADATKTANVIRIRAVGIDRLSLFLNDDIVDLDKPVRIEINGHVEHDAKLTVEDKRLERLARDFDFLFNREPIRTRSSFYFGWLTPARVVELSVRSPNAARLARARGESGSRATPSEERRAERLWHKAQDLKRNGLHDREAGVLQRILNLPYNAYTERAARALGRPAPRPAPTPEEEVRAARLWRKAHETLGVDVPPRPAAAAGHTASGAEVSAFLPCPPLRDATPADDAPTAPPLVTGPVRRLDPPETPPPHDAGDVVLETPERPRSVFDWRWMLAVALAVVAIRLAVRKR